ncbi:MAG: response regulator transcription factor [Sedimentisphaerales bacterium]|nr:response regulator transcription factor [Sedimentisphaerales bacterium]
MDNTTPTVYVVDDDQAVCHSLSLLIQGVGLHVQTFNTAEDFLAAYDPDRSGCLIIDVRMPGMSGLELQHRLLDQGIGLPSIVITGHGDIPMAVDAMRTGVVDFIEKPFRDQVLLDDVQKALQLDVKNRKRRAQTTDIKARTSLLTPREEEIMNMLVSGISSKAIAYELDISQKTVDFHRAHILEKMHVDSVVELVLLNQELQPA